jgi:threonine/homoserine/homoserine lactone efflux protein
MVARTALASSRANGVAAAIGMGFGAVVFSTAALLGLQAILATVPLLYLVLKIGGGAYLIYLAFRIWTGAKRPFEIHSTSEAPVSQEAKRSFFLGLATQVSNPKTAVVYGSIFASLLPQHVSATLMTALPILVFFIEAGWYSIVAVLLSSASPRDLYLRYKSWVDRAAGSIMGLLGLRLIFSSTKT